MTSAVDQLPYFTGSGTATTTTLTTVGRSILDDTSNAAVRSTLGIPVGSFDANPVVAPVRKSINAQTGTTYAPSIGNGTSTHDEFRFTTLNNAAAITVTLPSNATSAFAVGAVLDFLQTGAGQVTFVAGSGATLNGTPGLKLRAPFSACSAVKIATNDWILVGDLAP